MNSLELRARAGLEILNCGSTAEQCHRSLQGGQNHPGVYMAWGGGQAHVGGFSVRTSIMTAFGNFLVCCYP